MGLLLEDPSLMIECRVSLSAFLQMFPAEHLRRVNANYYTAPCISHKGLRSMIGFHFREFPFQIDDLLLNDIEFYRESYPDLKASFADFQSHFEKVYGSAQVMGESESFPIYRWVIPGAEIWHSVSERFVLGEHLHIFC